MLLLVGAVGTLATPFFCLFCQHNYCLHQQQLLPSSTGGMALLLLSTSSLWPLPTSNMPCDDVQLQACLLPL
jgi:hypothetical protein